MTKTRDLANLIADSKVGPSEIDTTGTYNMNALQVGGTTVIDSSRNGSFADLEFTGSLTHAWTNSGVISIGVAQRGGNTFNTGQNLLQVMGADAYIGGQAMAGGDLLLRGGFAVDNAGLSAYPGDVTIRGGVPHSGTDGNGGKIYLQTGGTSENRLTIRGDGNIGVGMAGSSSAKFTIQGKAGTSGNFVTDKALHVIEGGYNNGNTFQVSDSSSASRFHVDGDGVVMVNAVQSTNGDFQVQTGNRTHGLFVNAANNQIYLGGSTALTATSFLNLGGIKFSNGASTGGEFLSWDNEGNTGNQSLLAYWYNGSSYRNRFRIAGDHGETVENGSGDDVDFRVASDGNQDMLFLDASANKIGIGSQSYNYGSALTVHANDSGGAPTSLFLRNSGTAGGSGATIQAGYTSGYGAQIRFSGNPSSYRMASTTFATVTGDGTTQDNVQISTSGDTIIYNDLGVGHAGNPNHVLDVESSVSGDWVSQIHNTHNSNGFGLKVRAGDNGDVNSFRVAAQNNDILLNVDGAGRATMPKQPRFHATKTSGHGTTGKITFNTADVNVGNNYNTSTGTFTAPVAGDYLITTTALSNNGTTIGLDLLKNGNRYAVTEESFTGAAYRSTSITAIVPLSANDTLQVHNKQGAYYGTSRYTFFAGHLIG